MDTFTITNYVKATDKATVTFVIAGTTYAGIKIQGLPHDTIANVKTFLRGYVDAYTAGKALEAAAQADISAEVKTLLNTATGF
jgi:hypothetical protein